jgi:hypothetical protein
MQQPSANLVRMLGIPLSLLTASSPFVVGREKLGRRSEVSRTL